MTFQHVPVLLQETLSGLNIQPEGIYVDARSAVLVMPAKLQSNCMGRAG